MTNWVSCIFVSAETARPYIAPSHRDSRCVWFKHESMLTHAPVIMRTLWITINRFQRLRTKIRWSTTESRPLRLRTNNTITLSLPQRSTRSRTEKTKKVGCWRVLFVARNGVKIFMEKSLLHERTTLIKWTERNFATFQLLIRFVLFQLWQTQSWRKNLPKIRTISPRWKNPLKPRSLHLWKISETFSPCLSVAKSPPSCAYNRLKAFLLPVSKY